MDIFCISLFYLNNTYIRAQVPAIVLQENVLLENSTFTLHPPHSTPKGSYFLANAQEAFVQNSSTFKRSLEHLNCKSWGKKKKVFQLVVLISKSTVCFTRGYCCRKNTKKLSEYIRLSRLQYDTNALTICKSALKYNIHQKANSSSVSV